MSRCQSPAGCAERTPTRSALMGSVTVSNASRVTHFTGRSAGGAGLLNHGSTPRRSSAMSSMTLRSKDDAEV